ncbi:hypothetical protein [Paraburkholderia sp. RL18-085-BIA-A]|uniref:hypothetical protein n=1 Tax=Paraburkholderia sp. RL18-085-BIA-A TaxID=3031633 RepID=UPI0038BCAEEB
MTHTNSRRAYEESSRSFSLARQPTAQQVHDLCGKFTQMAADYFDGPVTLALPVGLRVVREPRRGRAA